MGKLTHYEQGQKMRDCTFVKEIGKRKSGIQMQRYAIFICQCGNQFECRITFVITGVVKSCGCARVKNAKKNFTIHGYTKNGNITSEYNAWNSMKSRCYIPKNKAYHNYGGRGIKVCDRWKNSFENFLTDMGLKHSPNHSLDRYPNYNGNYEPSNCRWATKKEQMENRRVSVYIIDDGVSISAKEYSKIKGIPYSTIMDQVHRGVYKTAPKTVLDAKNN